MTTLRRVCRFAYGEALAAEDRAEGDVPVYGSGGLTGWHDRPNLGGPGIVIGRKGSYGTVHDVPRPCFVIDTAFGVDAFMTVLDLRYLYYLLQSLRLQEGTNDVGVPGLSREDAYDRALPPLPESQQQRRIADFLDDQIARLDAAVECCAAAKTRVSERLDATLLALFEAASAGDVSVRRLLAGPAEYGLVPNRVLGEGEGPRYIRTTDIDDDGRLRSDTVKAVPAYEARPYLLRPGDVLVSRAGSIGRCHVFDAAQGPAVFAGYLVRLRFRSLDPHLFRLWLRTSAFRAQVAVGVVRSTIENFNAERYKDLRMPSPAEGKQLGLLRDLRAAEQQAEEAASQFEQTTGLLDERKRALITACVTGEFDVSTASRRAGDAALAEVPHAG